MPINKHADNGDIRRQVTSNFGGAELGRPLGQGQRQDQLVRAVLIDAGARLGVRESNRLVRSRVCDCFGGLAAPA